MALFTTQAVLQISGRFLLAALFLVAAASTCYAQEDPLIRDIIEQLAPEFGEDYDFSELTENLSSYRRKPLDLNKADQLQLRLLVFLSPLQISNFLAYRSSNGLLKNVLELQSIDGFDVQTVERLLPFVRIGAKSDTQELLSKQIIKPSDQELLLRYAQVLEKQRGYQELPGSHYLGTREKLFGKYKYRYKDMITASLVIEKDAGEYLFSGNNKSGMDFMSGNITYNGNGAVKKVILGDYGLQFGQGLTMWSGFGYGKGPDVTSVAKKDLGLRPYTSANEISFLRGLGINVSLAGKLGLTAFGSSRNLDASTKTAEDGTITQVNMSTSGLHRTATEISNQNALAQQVVGAAFQYLTDNLNAGVVAYGSHYANPFVTGPLGYNQYNFSGTDLYNLGIHYNYTYENIYLYGELAHSLEGGYAMIQGAMLSLSKAVSAVAVVRRYDKDYHSFFSRSLGETNEARNESGLYTGLNYSPNKKISFALYGDVFKFPWLRYRVDLPSKGHEILAQGIYMPTKAFKFTLRFKTESKQQNPDEKSDSTYIVTLNKSNYRLAMVWQLNKMLSLEQRAEFVRFNKGSVHDIGFLVYQDIAVQPSGKKLWGNVRLAYFKTDSYNSRLYAYEDDVLYSAGFGMYNGRGIRSYINLRYKIIRNLDLWARYAVFIYQDVNSVGSGLDLIDGNKKNEVKFQMRYQF